MDALSVFFFFFFLALFEKSAEERASRIDIIHSISLLFLYFFFIFFFLSSLHFSLPRSDSNLQVWITYISLLFKSSYLHRGVYVRRTRSVIFSL